MLAALAALAGLTALDAFEEYPPLMATAWGAPATAGPLATLAGALALASAGLAAHPAALAAVAPSSGPSRATVTSLAGVASEVAALAVAGAWAAGGLPAAAAGLMIGAAGGGYPAVVRSSARGAAAARPRGEVGVSVIESVRGVLWARRRQPDDVAYLMAAAHERFAPAELVAQAQAAEAAGFDGVCCSDHTAPWWAPDAAPAACGNAWVWLGAVGQATSEISIGTAVTALVHRYNPLVVAQQLATLEEMFPGRAFLGVGSGEAMNEVPAGMRWPGTGEQLARTEEALTIITRLLDGETVDFEGRFFRAHRARLYLRTPRRPPVYMSAFHEGAAEVAGRLADGLWTLGDPQTAPGMIAAHRRAAEAAGREPAEIILQTLASFGATDEEALESSREWKGTLVDEAYTDDLPDPARIGAAGARISDAKYTAMSIVSADPAVHARKLKLLRGMGATAIVVMNVSGADPLGLIRAYGESVLPELRS